MSMLPGEMGAGRRAAAAAAWSKARAWQLPANRSPANRLPANRRRPLLAPLPTCSAGGNAYYRQLILSSFAEPIEAASINGQALRRDARTGSRWEWSAGGRPLNATVPATVKLTSASGAPRTAALDSLQGGGGEAWDLGVQF